MIQILHLVFKEFPISFLTSY